MHTRETPSIPTALLAVVGMVASVAWTTSACARRSSASAVAASSAPTVSAQSCRASELAGALWSIANANTMRYGWIVLRDVGAQPCVLRGEVTVAGLASSGEPDTMTQRYTVARDIALTPNAPAVKAGALPPASETVAFVLVGDGYVVGTGPKAGSDCAAADTRYPTEFRLGLGQGSVSARNASFGLRPDERLFSCGGRLMDPTPITAAP